MKRHLKTLLKAALSVLILYLVLRAIDERQLLHLLRSSSPLWLLWALLWFTASKILAAFRFNTLLLTEGIQLSAGRQLRLYWVGMYYNLLLPGGISGDGYKIKLLMNATGRPFRRLFAITLFDRLSGLLALGQLLLALAFFLPILQPWRWAAAAGLLATVPVSVWLYRRMITRTADEPSARQQVKVAIQALAVQVAQLLSLLGIVLALGEGRQWLGYAALFLVSSVAAMLPLTIGGTGARELTFLWGAAWLHVDAERAVAIAFLFYLISTAVALFGLAFSFQTQRLEQTPSTPA
jgi:uncharacterized membrane protein YbhN (UPF0104 family)